MAQTELVEQIHPKGGAGPSHPFGFRFVTPLAVGAMLNPINSTMISTALFPIAQSLHVGLAQAAWLIAGLYLTSAVAQPTMGRFVDLFGPRRVYLTSLVFVAAAGVFGQLASSLIGLVLVRVLLGIGTSGAYPAAMRLFRTQADRIGAKPPRVAMGVLSLTSVGTTAVGPLLGGVLTGTLGWHAVFAVNVPLALLAVLMVLLWIPKDQPGANHFRIAHLGHELDVLGLGLFTSFLLSLMIFLMNLNRPIWLALMVAVLLGAAFVWYSLRRQQPFIDVRMLAHNHPLTITYLRVIAVLMLVYCVFYGLAQWLESAVGLPSATAGLVTLPMSVVAAISSLTGVRTKGLRGPFLFSIGAAVAGGISLLFVTSGTPIWLIAVAFMCFGVPLGTFSTATQAAIYIQAPPEQIGTAAGMQRTASYIGAITSTSLLALFYGQRATDLGMHSLAATIGGIGAVLFIATLFDRTIPREA